MIDEAELDSKIKSFKENMSIEKDSLPEGSNVEEDNKETSNLDETSKNVV